MAPDDTGPDDPTDTNAPKVESDLLDYLHGHRLDLETEETEGFVSGFNHALYLAEEHLVNYDLSQPCPCGRGAGFYEKRDSGTWYCVECESPVYDGHPAGVAGEIDGPIDRTYALTKAAARTFRTSKMSAFEFKGVPGFHRYHSPHDTEDICAWGRSALYAAWDDLTEEFMVGADRDLVRERHGEVTPETVAAEVRSQAVDFLPMVSERFLDRLEDGVRDSLQTERRFLAQGLYENLPDPTEKDADETEGE